MIVMIVDWLSLYMYIQSVYFILLKFNYLKIVRNDVKAGKIL